VTLLLGMLRCGAPVESILAFAPGVRCDRLHAAYLLLDKKRCASVASWAAIVEDPTRLTIRENAISAVRLLPTPMYRLTEMADRLRDAQLDRIVATFCEQIDIAHDQADELENSLASSRISLDQAVEVGKELYNPHTPSVWGQPFYLARRVGDLMPLRVADLLGERRT
jgi:hypothetical protein